MWYITDEVIHWEWRYVFSCCNGEEIQALSGVFAIMPNTRASGGRDDACIEKTGAVKSVDLLFIKQ